MPLFIILSGIGANEISATPKECRNRIIKNEHLTDEEVSITRGKNGVNKFENEVAFARAYLVGAGYIDGEQRGLWVLTEKGQNEDLTEQQASDIFKNGISKPSVKDSMPDAGIRSVHYWMYAPGKNAAFWEKFYQEGIMGIGWEEMGDLRTYPTKEEMREKMRELYGYEGSIKNSSLATWQFCNDIKIGDVIFVKKGQFEIVGRGVVQSDYEYNEDKSEYNHIRSVNWTHKGSWRVENRSVQKTLTDISQYTDYVENLSALFKNEDFEGDNVETKEILMPYTKENFLQDVFIDSQNYSKLLGVLHAKHNIILQGAPGVGKTYMAKRLAYSIMGVIGLFL